jgi:hypothetical protein
VALDWNAIWQERRSLVVAVAALGSLVLLGESAIGMLVANRARRARADVGRLERELSKASPTREDATGVAERAALAEARLEEARAAVLFAPRPDFVLEAGSASPEVRYLAEVEKVRERLLPTAKRAGLKLPASLGLPSSAPANDEEVAGILVALDAIERACEAALETRLRSVESIRIVDSKPKVSKEFGGLLLQEVALDAVGEGEAVLAWISALRERGFVFGTARVEAKATGAREVRFAVPLRLFREAPPPEEAP